MTLRVVIDKWSITIFEESKYAKSKVIQKFAIPYSFEEFRVWYDFTNQQPNRIAFENRSTHRKLCRISRRKFESFDFPELEYIKELMLGIHNDEE